MERRVTWIPESIHGCRLHDWALVSSCVSWSAGRVSLAGSKARKLSCALGKSAQSFHRQLRAPIRCEGLLINHRQSRVIAPVKAPIRIPVMVLGAFRAVVIGMDMARLDRKIKTIEHLGGPKL